MIYTIDRGKYARRAQMKTNIEGGYSMSMVITTTNMTRRAYSGNTLFKDADYRKTCSNHDTVSADRKAMIRALDRLDTLDFDSTDEDDTKTIFNSVSSYVDVYNNAVTSALASDSSNIKSTGRQMKSLTKEYASQLEDMGITVKNNGTLKIDKSELQTATTRQVSKVFGNDDYKSSMKSLMKKLRNQVNREQVQLSDSVGNNLNLSV
jgi:hypothetical protein